MSVYTPDQAQYLKLRTEVEIARIEDIAHRILDRVTDHDLDLHVETLLEQFRQVGHAVTDIIDSRTLP